MPARGAQVLQSNGRRWDLPRSTSRPRLSAPRQPGTPPHRENQCRARSALRRLRGLGVASAWSASGRHAATSSPTGLVWHAALQNPCQLPATPTILAGSNWAPRTRHSMWIRPAYLARRRVPFWAWCNVLQVLATAQDHAERHVLRRIPACGCGRAFRRVTRCLARIVQRLPDGPCSESPLGASCATAIE